ncbi:hypothetical protein Aam_020_011 [Acidocella aminolytica 101 = DSM 11237]|uniref:Uncharacterized protein n=1 Tax=Acidocella aminolytica 101 = DSM 11237 TaxID=1120923 RepID=A0A0D6PC63_9PROT|nr:hypothetical protein Aam_020_011 [Acidocella aminolytica 101 = DSM 11237]GBQ39746.1 hypothetical protein AA11237_2169 [Acidocella aminolytica 101 = DSM 11237]
MTIRSMQKHMARNNIAGRQILAVHEVVSSLINQSGSFATHCLRHQGQRRLFNCKSRRMKLDKLQIFKFRACFHRKNQPLPHGRRRIGRIPEKPTDSPGGKQNPVSLQTQPVAIALNLNS